MTVLVVNAGSSSVKLVLVGEGEDILAERLVEAPDGHFEVGELRAALRGDLGRADAVGHRVVHGGETFRDAVVIDDRVRSALEALRDLAPLHQPRSLTALDAVRGMLGDRPHVACFDTAFHATLPPAAATYAVPQAWRERLGVRRYGFHGLSHAWVARRVPALLNAEPERLRIVSCHLGAGASLCAIAGGRSVETTMGFTPLDGVVMATRSGSVDPGLVLWLATHAGLEPAEIADALEHRSGLLALAGTADMREVLARVEAAHPAATAALDVYVHRLVATVAAMAAAMRGLDVLSFTGGVGEHAAVVRARVAEELGWAGVALNGELNAGGGGDAGEDREITRAGAAVRVVVVRAREDAEIARQTRAVLGAE